MSKIQLYFGSYQLCTGMQISFIMNFLLHVLYTLLRINSIMQIMRLSIFRLFYNTQITHV